MFNFNIQAEISIEMEITIEVETIFSYISINFTIKDCL